MTTSGAMQDPSVTEVMKKIETQGFSEKQKLLLEFQKLSYGPRFGFIEEEYNERVDNAIRRG